MLLWDDPETNLDPKLFHPLIDVLLKLQRTGVQVLLATHDYVILKELDLCKRDTDQVLFHSLYRVSSTISIFTQTQSVTRRNRLSFHAQLSRYSPKRNR